MMAEKNPPPPTKPARPSLVSLVTNAPRPTLESRGRLLGITKLREILPPRSNGKPRTNWWFNHSFLPSKRVKVGRDNAWWEADVLEAIDKGVLTE